MKTFKIEFNQLQIDIIIKALNSAIRAEIIADKHVFESFDELDEAMILRDMFTEDLTDEDIIFGFCW